MPARVVDASVVAAWCFRESRAQEARPIVLGSELHAPLILAFELASIARKKAAAHPDKRVFIEEALRTALALHVHWSDVDHLAVMRIALRLGLTTYDASYLWLARSGGMPLATFDEALARASAE